MVKITEVVLVYCDTINNDYHQDSRVLYAFITNKLFGDLLDISPQNFIFWNTFDSEFSYIEVWLFDQNSKPFEM